MSRLTCLTRSICLGVALTTLCFTANAQQGTSARQAIGLVSSQFGPRSVQWIAEMRGQQGIPQPSHWEILAFDERAPRLLYKFWAGEGRAGDSGMDQDHYPTNVPVGYFGINQVGVDSVAAFTIAEGEARKARVAFDSCEYLLRVRDFSNEPVWKLELLDTHRSLVGKVYISGTSGTVLRTVWIYRDQRARPDGLPLIIDSFAPTGQRSLPNLSRSDFSVPPGDGIHSRVPDEGAIAGNSVPTAPPVPGMSRVPSSNQPYRPVGPSGVPADDGIPDPPAISSESSGGPSMAQTPPAPSSGPVGDLRDLREDPPATKPAPSTAPTGIPESSAGSSGRIPPPPIPQ